MSKSVFYYTEDILFPLMQQDKLLYNIIFKEKPGLNARKPEKEFGKIKTRSLKHGNSL